MDALIERLSDENPAWKLRIMLDAMRAAGWSFDQAWYSATQRLRVQAWMGPDDIEELMEFKAWFDWSKEYWRWAYEDGEAARAPVLADGEVFTAAELAILATHETG